MLKRKHQGKVRKNVKKQKTFHELCLKYNAKNDVTGEVLIKSTEISDLLETIKPIINYVLSLGKPNSFSVGINGKNECKQSSILVTAKENHTTNQILNKVNKLYAQYDSNGTKKVPMKNEKITYDNTIPTLSSILVPIYGQAVYNVIRNKYIDDAKYYQLKETKTTQGKNMYQIEVNHIPHFFDTFLKKYPEKKTEFVEACKDRVALDTFKDNKWSKEIRDVLFSSAINLIENEKSGQNVEKQSTNNTININITSTSSDTNEKSIPKLACFTNNIDDKIMPNSHVLQKYV